MVVIYLWHGALFWWKSTFFFFLCGRFWQFLPPNAPLMLYNIYYWWFFLSQGNWWTKYLVHPKIQRPKPCLLMFASLVTLDGFHLLLLSTQRTADLTLEWRGGSMFHPLSHIYGKTPFCCIKTLANIALNRWRVIFDRLWANMTLTLNKDFSLTNIHAKWWIHYLLISSTPPLSHATSIYYRPKRVCGVFFVFSWTTIEFGWPYEKLCLIQQYAMF